MMMMMGWWCCTMFVNAWTATSVYYVCSPNLVVLKSWELD